MKKLKLLAIGIGLAGASLIGTSIFATSEAKAEKELKCEWNGEHCKNPTKSNYCGCE
jgi:hypothetical protein